MIMRFFFDKPINGASLWLLRRGTGFALLVAMLALWPDFSALYGPDGVLPPALVSELQPPIGIPFPDIVQAVHDTTGWPMAWLLHGSATLYAMLCVMLIGGRYHRAVAGALLLLHGSLFTVQPAYSYGFDFLGSVALSYCFLLPRQPGSPWAKPGLRVLQLHLCLIYFFSGISKAVGHTWRNGEALYKALGVPAMPPIIPLETTLPTLGEFPFVFAMMGWAVISLEVGYSAGIWWRHTHPVFLYGTLALHAAIALLLGLYHFSLLMIVLNCSAFLSERPPRSRGRRAGITEAAKSTPSLYRPAV